MERVSFRKYKKRLTKINMEFLYNGGKFWILKNPVSQLASIKSTHLEEIKCNQKLIPHLYSNTIQLTSLDNLIKVSYNPYCIYIHNIPLRWSVAYFLPGTDGSRRDQLHYQGGFFTGKGGFHLQVDEHWLGSHLSKLWKRRILPILGCHQWTKCPSNKANTCQIKKREPKRRIMEHLFQTAGLKEGIVSSHLFCEISPLTSKFLGWRKKGKPTGLYQFLFLTMSCIPLSPQKSLSCECLWVGYGSVWNRSNACRYTFHTSSVA